MNILPKKSWHVRTKKNIERVRKDEEQAAEEEKERQRRIAVAESEARTEILRVKARKPHNSEEVEKTEIQKHINFFEDIEAGKKLGGKNAEHEEEKRLEKERQEKAIGLLTYLGQGSVELEATKPWYFQPPAKRKSEPTSQSGSAALAGENAKDEFDRKRKRSLDPLNSMAKYVDQSRKLHEAKEGKSESTGGHHKRHKSVDSCKAPSSGKTVEQLRAERLRREQTERERSRQLLAKINGEPSSTRQPEPDERQRRYNSQFNPDFVRKRPSDWPV